METCLSAISNPQPSDTRTAERVRLVAVVLVAVIALIYLLIGLQVVTVIDEPSEQTAFGLIAAGAFAAGGVILARSKSRIVSALGAVMVAFVVFTYFSLAPERSPQFEIWGIALRVLQVMLFAGLTYSTVRPPSPETAPDRPEQEMHGDSSTAGAAAKSGPTIHQVPPV